MSWVSQLCLERKPCWNGLSMSFESKWVMMLDTKICAINLEAIHVGEIGL